MEIQTVVPIIISIIAIGIAIWQGVIAKLQLEQAKTTKTETEKLLQDVKEKVSKIESLTDETRKDVREQVARLIDKQDENFKTLLTAPQKDSQNELIAQLLPQLLSNPDIFKTLVELSGNQK